MRIAMAIVSLNDQIFVDHCRAEKTGSFAEHFVGEKAGAVPIVNDRFFDVGNQGTHAKIVDVSQG